MNRIGTLAAVVGLTGGLAMAAAGASPAGAAPGVAAQITDTGCAGGALHCFTPQSIPVAAGTTVVWTSGSTAPHTVTCDRCTPGGGPSSGSLSRGGSYSFTFTAPGTYTYHCDFHAYMTGRVVVSGSATPAPTPVPTPPPPARPTPRPTATPTAAPPPVHVAIAPPSMAPSAAPVAPTPPPAPAPTVAPAAETSPAPPAQAAVPAAPGLAAARTAPAGSPLPVVVTVTVLAAVLAAGGLWLRRSRR